MHRVIALLVFEALIGIVSFGKFLLGQNDYIPFDVWAIGGGVIVVIGSLLWWGVESILFGIPDMIDEGVARKQKGRSRISEPIIETVYGEVVDEDSGRQPLNPRNGQKALGAGSSQAFGIPIWEPAGGWADYRTCPMCHRTSWNKVVNDGASHQCRKCGAVS